MAANSDKPPEHEDDRRPAPIKRTDGGGNGPSILLLLLGGGVLVLCVLGGAGGLVFALMGSVAPLQDRQPPPADKPPAKEPLAKLDKMKHVENDDRMLVARGKVILDQTGRLTAKDARDPTPEGKEVKARMKVHQVQMQPGKTYVILLTSDDFDTALRIESPAGIVLAEEEDGDDDDDSRIVFRPTEAGMYRVIASNTDGEFGRYRLKVQEAD